MANLKVLVIAELDSIGQFISNLLSREGFDVTVVDSSRSVKETCMEIHAELSRKNYDVVLPTNNGLTPNAILDLIPVIKRENPGSNIIVLSGFKTQEFIRDLKERGIDDFLSMPFAPDDFVQKVKTILIRKN